MSRRRTVDASTLLDLNWSTNHFPLPPPDGASPLRPQRSTLASASTALSSVAETPPRRSLTHSTPQVLHQLPLDTQQCLETPPRRSLVVAMTTENSDDDEENEVPMSPRGAPDGRVEIEDVDEGGDRGSGRDHQSVHRTARQESLGGGRTETEDDEDSSSEDDDEDDRSDVSDIVVRDEDQDPFAATTGLPKTFNLSLSYEDRFEAYVYDILGNATVDQVHRLFKGYMEENILPNGWLGIWRSGGVFGSAPIGESTASVLVEIENVIISADAEKLDAVATVSLPGKEDASVDNDRHFRAVVVNHPGSPNSSIFNNSWTNPPPAASVDPLPLVDVESELESRGWNIPLLDIHPIFQRHGGAKLTATALENVRFFYKHIWRAWDSDIAKDEPYASQCLQSRMSLHYDLEEGKVNPEDQERYEKTVSQYEDVRTQLKALHNSMDVSDSENELDEVDLAQCAALYEKEMALETAIQALENPLLRFLQHDANFSKMKRALALRMRGQNCESVTHVVAKVFRARMTAFLDPNAIVEHHPTLTSAMENFSCGDTIHVHEGIYSGGSLMSIVNGTKIVGQISFSSSPGPRRRPVQVSESVVDEEVVSGDNFEEADKQKDKILGHGDDDENLSKDQAEAEAKPMSNDEDKENAVPSHLASSSKTSSNVDTSVTHPNSSASIELQFAFNSQIVVDIDPDSSPATIENLLLRHLSPADSGTKSQEPSPTRGGVGGRGSTSQSEKGDSTNAEVSICVRRGCLILNHVTLIISSVVGISVHEGASLKMNDCIIVGAESTAILAHTDSSVETSGVGVRFVDCAAEVKRSVDVGRLPVSVVADSSATTETR